MIKQRTTPARTPKKLAINKDKLRSVSQDELANVNGGEAPLEPHKVY